MNLKFRHECKHEINRADQIALRQRLRQIARPDEHAPGELYKVCGLYFDTPGDKALREKEDGISPREKFRLRYYNDDLTVIRLEKKSKIGGLGNKQGALLTQGEVQGILDGDWEWMLHSDQALLRELYLKMKAQGLRPKSIVEYQREAFVYPPGNVRVTLDSDIRTGMGCRNFLQRDRLTFPARDAPAILEVKWDEFLPDVIRDAVQLRGRQTAAFSKYAACRGYF